MPATHAFAVKTLATPHEVVTFMARAFDMLGADTFRVCPVNGDPGYLVFFQLTYSTSEQFQAISDALGPFEMESDRSTVPD